MTAKKLKKSIWWSHEWQVSRAKPIICDPASLQHFCSQNNTAHWSKRSRQSIQTHGKRHSRTADCTQERKEAVRWERALSCCRVLCEAHTPKFRKKSTPDLGRSRFGWPGPLDTPSALRPQKSNTKKREKRTRAKLGGRNRALEAWRARFRTGIFVCVHISTRSDQLRHSPRNFKKNSIAPSRCGWPGLGCGRCGSLV